MQKPGNFRPLLAAMPDSCKLIRFRWKDWAEMENGPTINAGWTIAEAIQHAISPELREQLEARSQAVRHNNQWTLVIGRRSQFHSGFDSWPTGESIYRRKLKRRRVNSKSLASTLHESGWVNVKRQLIEGTWTARGRCGSSTAPYTTIPPSAWIVLRLHNSEKSIVSEGKGNHIYDIRIYPTISSDEMFHVNSIEHAGLRSNAEVHQEAPSSKRIIAKCTARNECADWLTQEMKKSPMKRVGTKNEWRDEAKKRWPQTLTKRQFDFAWEAAKRLAGAERWGSAGRQRK